MTITGRKLVLVQEPARDLEFNVVIEGKGEPVLLLHGFPDSAQVWSYQIDYLTARGYQVIAPDLRGFGESAKPRDSNPDRDVELYTIQRSIEDIGGILKQAQVKPPVHVVGHDWGAVVGWVMASMTPTRPLVRSLVAMSIGHPRAYKSPSIEQREKSWYIYFFQHERAEFAIARDPTFLRDWSRYDDPESLERWQRDLSRPGALTVALNWYRANASPDPKKSIVDGIEKLQQAGTWGNVQVPTLGIVGARDPHATSDPMKKSGEFVAPRLWQFKLIDAGHWLQREQPTLVNSLLTDFLKSVP